LKPANYYVYLSSLPYNGEMHGETLRTLRGAIRKAPLLTPISNDPKFGFVFGFVWVCSSMPLFVFNDLGCGFPAEKHHLFLRLSAHFREPNPTRAGHALGGAASLPAASGARIFFTFQHAKTASAYIQYQKPMRPGRPVRRTRQFLSCRDQPHRSLSRRRAGSVAAEVKGFTDGAKRSAAGAQAVIFMSFDARKALSDRSEEVYANLEKPA
jgi:hypothetical protein